MRLLWIALAAAAALTDRIPTGDYNPDEDSVNLWGSSSGTGGSQLRNDIQKMLLPDEATTAAPEGSLLKNDPTLISALALEDPLAAVTDPNAEVDPYVKIKALRQKIALADVQIKALELAVLEKPDFNAFAEILKQVTKDRKDMETLRKTTQTEFEEYKKVEFAMVAAFQEASIKMASDVAFENKGFDRHLSDLRMAIQKEYRELGTLTPPLTAQIQKLQGLVSRYEVVLDHMNSEDAPYLDKIETLNKALDKKVQRLHEELEPLKEAAEKEGAMFASIETQLATADSNAAETSEQLGKTRLRLQEEEDDLETSMSGLQSRMQRIE